MNRMNLPPPFGAVTPTPPIVGAYGSFLILANLVVDSVEMPMVPTFKKILSYKFVDSLKAFTSFEDGYRNINI